MKSEAFGRAVLGAAALFAIAAACSSKTDDSQAIGAGPEDLGKVCVLPGAEPEPCSAELSCLHAEIIGGDVCTKGCDTDAECPDNSLCYINGPRDGHVCARLCFTDADCLALFPSASPPGTGLCRGDSEVSARKICGGY